MKKKWMLLLAVLFLINSALVSSYFYEISHNCSEDVCIEGQNAEWYVTIFNRGTLTLEYSKIELLNSLNNSQIAVYDSGFQPLSIERGDTILVSPMQKATVRLNGTLPKANFGKMLIYYPCFTTVTPNDDWTHRQKNIYEIINCYDSNESMPLLQCISDSDCRSDESCINNKCSKLKCNDCQYISNHSCKSFSCCISDHCKNNEFCANNTCFKLDCKEEEYLFNHSCMNLSCSQTQAIINHACNEVNCSFDEFMINHKCQKLNCSYNEHIVDNACALLQCAEEEKPGNHTCIALKCSFNETISNHECSSLDCYFFQRIENHKCISDKPLIYRLIAELTAVILIILFIVLDVKKYLFAHKKTGK